MVYMQLCVSESPLLELIYQQSTCWHFYSFGYILCLTFPTPGHLLGSNGKPPRHVQHYILDQRKVSWRLKTDGWKKIQSHLIPSLGEAKCHHIQNNGLLLMTGGLAETRSLQRASAQCQDSKVFLQWPKERMAIDAQRQVKGITASFQ